MPRTAFVLALVLLTAGLAGCLGGEETNAPTAEDGNLSEQSRPSNESTEDGEDSSDEAKDEEREEDESSEEDEDSSDEEGAGDPQAEEEAEDEPAIEVVRFNGSVRGQSAPVLGPFCIETCDNQFEFAVANETTELLAEIAWEADASILFDVDIPYEKCEAAMGEDCPPASTSGAEGYLTIHLTDPGDIVAGDWMASAWAEDSPAQAVDFTIAVSTTGDELPGDHAELAP